MASAPLLSLLLLILVASSSAATPSKPHALLFKVTKDPYANQYITEIKQRTPAVPVKLTFDLGGDTLWVDCDKGYVSSTYKPVHCNSSLCKFIDNATACGSTCNGPRGPGCNNDTCSQFPENSVAPLATIGEVAQDVISVQSTDGSNPGKNLTFPGYAFTCGATFLLKGLANGVKGIAGFSKSVIGVPSQLSREFKIPRIFAICLGPLSGFAIIGDGPYNVLPNVDLSEGLTYTPLVPNPLGKAGNHYAGNNPANEYYIGVTGIKVNNQRVPVNTRLLKINKQGKGGTKISTVAPFTILERSIYNAITNAFVSALSKVPRVKAAAPFTVCYNPVNFASTLLGPAVPSIELVLQKENVSWTFFGLNSMVFVKEATLCLGFVDGGVDAQTSIVIGGNQLDDAFLQFDLGRSRLGFASTIAGRRTTCSNFNFTANV